MREFLSANWFRVTALGVAVVLTVVFFGPLRDAKNDISDQREIVAAQQELLEEQRRLMLTRSLVNQGLGRSLNEILDVIFDVRRHVREINRKMPQSQKELP